MSEHRKKIKIKEVKATVQFKLVAKSPKTQCKINIGTLYYNSIIICIKILRYFQKSWRCENLTAYWSWCRAEGER